MRIFSLATMEDFSAYIATLFLLVVPIILILLIPYFLFTTKFIDGLSYIFNFIKSIPIWLQWLLFTVIPVITLTHFFFRGPKTIFIDKDAIEVEYKSNKRERIDISDIKKFIAYKTTTPWTWGDLSQQVNYSSLFPITIYKESGGKMNMLMKGEIWNSLKETYPNVPIEQISIFNHYSLIIVLIATLNLLNGIIYVFLALGNR